MSDEKDILAPEVEETPAAPATSDPSKTKGKMDALKWAEAVAMAEVEGRRGSDIARHFGVSPSLVSRYFNDNSVIIGSKMKKVQDKAVDLAAQAMAEKISEFSIARKQRIMETKIDHYAWSTALAKQGMSLIIEAKKAGKALGNLNPDLKALRQTMILVKQAREERFAVLDAEHEIDESSLPEIIIQDLTDEQIENLQKAEEGDDLDIDGDTKELVDIVP